MSRHCFLLLVTAYSLVVAGMRGRIGRLAIIFKSLLQPEELPEGRIPRQVPQLLRALPSTGRDDGSSSVMTALLLRFGEAYLR